MQRTSVKPAIEVIAGPAHSAKTARIIHALGQALEAGEQAVLILPTARAARSLRTELLLDGTFNFLGGPRVLTFVQFAEQVLEQHAGEVQPIEPMMQDELLAGIIAELGAAGKMTYHTRVLNFRGFVRAVRAFLMELKRAEITPEQFEGFAARRGASNKDRELSAVYSRYQEMLQELGLYDAEGRFWRAKLLVSANKLGPFADLRRLFLDGFYDFTPTQLALIEVLGDRGVKLTVSLPLEENSGRPELFESAEATLEKLRDRFEPMVEVLPAKELAEPALAWLSGHLFQSGPISGAPEPGAIRLIETPGTVAEVREIAREIKRLHLEEHIPLEQVAVVFRTLAEYRDIVEGVFSEFGIKARTSRGTRLCDTLIGRLLLQILRLPVEGWQSRAVMSLLKSNYVSTSVLGLDGEGLSLARFEELVTEAGILRGRASWIKNLRALRERVAWQLESAHLPSDEEIRRRLDPVELQEKDRDLARAEETSEKLFELFDGLEKAESIAQFLDALFGVAQQLKVKECILKARGCKLAARDLESMAAIGECLNVLLRTSAIVGDTRCTLADSVKQLRLAFEESWVWPERADFGRVQVCEVHEVRALSFDVVFIGGLLERSFPRMRREGPFYDDVERARMNAQGLNVQPRRLDQREERFLFYLAATRAKRRLYLSYPVTDREGKEKLVSYYVGEVRRIFAPHELETRKVTLSTKVVGIDESASLQELRRAAVMKLAESRLSKSQRLACASMLLRAGEDRSAPVLKRGLEAEAERDSWDPFGPYDGVLSHTEAIGELTRRFGTDHDFSVTALEQYGCCPFAFYCHAVLGVEAPAEAPEELEAVDEGIILHRTLRQFYSERRERSEDVRIREDEIDEAARHICEIADAHLDRFHRRNPDLNEGVFRVQRERLRELLVNFVRAEVESGRKDRFGMIPRFFEVAFGLRVNPEIADARSTSKRLLIDIEGEPPVGIVGKIDRIDVTGIPVGEGEACGFRIIDYKRGKAPSGTGAIEEGTAFQMPVYLAAARDVILADENFEPVDAQFYGLRDMKAKPAVRLLKSTRDGIEPVPEADKLMATAVAYIREYVSAIRAGKFPVLRRGSETCPGYCEFREVCRYSELRAQKKRGEFKPWFERRQRDTDE